MEPWGTRDGLRRRQQALKETRAHAVQAPSGRQVRADFRDTTLEVGHHLPQIGDVRGRILATLFRQHLTDLYAADQVQGVSRAQYLAIRAWVVSYQVRLPEFMQMDFPGKREILARYEQQRRMKEDMLSSLTKQASELDSRLARVRSEVARLEKVKPEHFVQALTGNRPASPELTHYLQGAFAEWEPMPDWFKEALGEAGNV